MVKSLTKGSFWESFKIRYRRKQANRFIENNLVFQKKKKSKSFKPFKWIVWRNRIIRFWGALHESTQLAFISLLFFQTKPDINLVLFLTISSRTALYFFYPSNLLGFFLGGSFVGITQSNILYNVGGIHTQLQFSILLVFILFLFFFLWNFPRWKRSLLIFNWNK